MAPPYGPPPPRVDAAILRPRRIWYAVAVAIMLATCVLAGFTFTWALHSVFDVGRGLEEIEGGHAVVRLAPDPQQVLYASRELTIATGVRDCKMSGPGPVRLAPVEGRKKVTEDSEWIAVAELRVTKAGRYSVTCSPGDTAVSYAVGPSVAVLSGRAGKAVAGTLGFFLLFGLGCGAGLTIILVTSSRRRRHRRLVSVSPGYDPVRR